MSAPGARPIMPTNFVDVQPIEYSYPDAPTTKTYHGLTIVVNGQIIGRIQSWHPKMYSRTGVHVFELSNLTYGRPVDYVPGKGDDAAYSLECGRVEMWNDEFEAALGFPEVWSDLMDQTHPFTISEYLFKGSQIYRIWNYYGCWFKSRDEANFEVEGDTKVMVNADIAFISRDRVK